jgi:transposase
LEKLTQVDFKVTYLKFKKMVLSYPALKTKSERQLQRLFGVGSHHTIKKWLESIDSEIVRENEYEEQELTSEEVSPEQETEINDVLKNLKPVKKPYI